MLFTFGKCKCVHLGHGNKDAQYTMSGTVLNTIEKDKDLGLTNSADMNVSEQCGIAEISQEGYLHARKSTKESNQNDTKIQGY